MTRVLYGITACLVLSSCLPEPSPGGVYACPSGDDMECPSGFECRSDNRCYGPDEPGLGPYFACDTEDDCRDDLDCVKIDNADVGTCTVTCSTAATCAADENGVAAQCSNVSMGVNACMQGCDDDDDCPSTHECLVVPMTMGERACYASPPSWLSVITCSSTSMQCPPSMMCAVDPAKGTQGVCSYPCAMMGEACPGTMGQMGFSECAMLGSITNATPSDAGCLRPCTNAEQCNNTNMVCAVIAGSSSPTKYCIPPGWQ